MFLRTQPESGTFYLWPFVPRLSYQKPWGILLQLGKWLGPHSQHFDLQFVWGCCSLFKTWRTSKNNWSIHPHWKEKAVANGETWWNMIMLKRWLHFCGQTRPLRARSKWLTVFVDDTSQKSSAHLTSCRQFGSWGRRGREILQTFSLWHKIRRPLRKRGNWDLPQRTVNRDKRSPQRSSKLSCQQMFLALFATETLSFLDIKGSILEPRLNDLYSNNMVSLLF